MKLLWPIAIWVPCALCHGRGFLMLHLDKHNGTAADTALCWLCNGRGGTSG